MRSVIDSSVAFKWVVPEADTQKAGRLRDDLRLQTIELLAPDVFAVELAHALTRGERQGRIPVGGALVLLADVLSVGLTLSPSLPLLLRACDISSQTRVGVYDCLYVALAEHESCDFVTADERLARTLSPRFPFIRTLASMP